MFKLNSVITKFNLDEDMTQQVCEINPIRSELGMWRVKIKLNQDSQKVNSNVSKARVNAGGVYNGKCKLIVQNRNFMTLNDVKICLDELSNKKCEGFDRIPVCMIYDAREKLLPPMATLFNDIYNTNKIPDQWKIAKIVPTFIFKWLGL